MFRINKTCFCCNIFSRNPQKIGIWNQYFSCYHIFPTKTSTHLRKYYAFPSILIKENDFRVYVHIFHYSSFYAFDMWSEKVWKKRWYKTWAPSYMVLVYKLKNVLLLAWPKRTTNYRTYTHFSIFSVVFYASS